MPDSFYQLLFVSPVFFIPHLKRLLVLTMAFLFN